MVIDANIVISNVIGGLVTLLVSTIFYALATRDLKKEAGELRHLSDLLLLGMEKQGWIRLNWDKTGEKIVGFENVINVGGGELHTHGHLAAVKITPPQEDSNVPSKGK